MDENKKQPVPSQKYSVVRKPDGTIEVKIVVDAADVEVVREKIVTELVKSVEVQGFRKGAAPRNLAEEKLNKATVKEEVLKKVLTDEYVNAVKALDLKPIINPRIHIEAFEDGTNLEFMAETCEQPKVELNNYKEEVKKIKPASTSSSLGGPAAPTPKIILPGQPLDIARGKEEKTDPQAGMGENPSTSSGQGKLDEILNVVLGVVTVNIPKILIDQEADRLLSQLLDELKKLGVSVDQYLASRNKNADQLRTEYSERAEKDLKLEFLLRDIADKENITVDQPDIERALASIKDDKERSQVAQNPYLVAAIIRQQKTLEFLTKI